MRLQTLSAGALAIVLAACTGAGPDEPLPLGSGAEDCGACHAEHLVEWQGSAHGRSARSPIFTALLPEVERAWGGFARTRCEGCHTPGHGGDDAVGCVSCHAAVGNHAERDGQLAVDLAMPIAGPFDDAAPTDAHASRRGDFLASPSLCGTCHEVSGPELLVEPTLSEYLRSPQAAIGQTCVDCHLPRDGERRLVDDDALRPRPVRSHRFVGFDPPWDAGAEEADAAAARTRELLATALSLSATRDAGEIAVAVTNVGAGHHVPTGAAFLRDLWVDLERDGAVIASRVLTIGDQPTKDGAPVALLTQADAVTHGSLAPSASATASIAVAPGTIEAVLRGRAIREEVLVALGVTALGPQLPTHEIARVRVEP